MCVFTVTHRFYGSLSQFISVEYHCKMCEWLGGGWRLSGRKTNGKCGVRMWNENGSRQRPAKLSGFPVFVVRVTKKTSMKVGKKRKWCKSVTCTQCKNEIWMNLMGLAEKMSLRGVFFLISGEVFCVA